jgi:hypothetical protein
MARFTVSQANPLEESTKLGGAGLCTIASWLRPRGMVLAGQRKNRLTNQVSALYFGVEREAAR